MKKEKKAGVIQQMHSFIQKMAQLNTYFLVLLKSLAANYMVGWVH